MGLLGKPTILGNLYIYNPRFTNWWRLGGNLPWSYVVFPLLAASSYWVGTSDLQRSASAASSEHMPRTFEEHHLWAVTSWPWLYICCIEGDEILHSYMGDCFISHEIQDPEIKTTRMTHGMSKQGFCSTLLKLGSRPSPSFHWDSSPVGIQCIFSNNDLAMFHHLRNDVLWKSWFCRGFKWWYSFHPDFVWCLRGTYSQKALL